VLARTSRPILIAEAEYEHDGFMQDVVFPSGHIDLGRGRIRVFYGAADEVVCAADLAIDDVLSTLTPV
jgi:beta-1,2-mannobiose phosphorylase / 1,2-beta-oligomannan phosphorylase